MTSTNLERFTLLKACQLRLEESTMDNYAADLQRSLEQELASLDSAREFFRSTHPAKSMKDICRRIFRRLTLGDASNEPSVYRLGSSFGGGKTHTLIALAGAAVHPDLIREGETTVPAEFAPDAPVRLVTFAGENSDVDKGALLPGTSGVRAKSLIGQMAWQLGGESAYSAFKSYDDNLTSPGSEDIRRLLGDEPCLILVDELVQLLDRITSSNLDSGLANTRTMFSSLVRAVGQSPRSVLVITTPDPANDAYQKATQDLLNILSEVDSVVARIAHQTISSESVDLPAIIRRRLFSDFDEEARSKVSRAYSGLWQRSSALIAPPPQNGTLEKWFEDHYPIHPDTLKVIQERIAANGNFQKTRGILRLLGKTAHHLKNSGQGETALLIHPHHIDPDNPDIHAELTTRIQQTEFDSAIVADITGAESTAAKVDETRPSRPARRIARTIFLASLSPIGTAKGVNRRELVRAVITPDDDDPSVVDNAVTEFRNNALYVNDDPGVAEIQFSSVPNLNRMLLDRRNALTAEEINQRVRAAITACFTMPNQRSQSHFQTTIFPSGADIPDNPNSVALGVLNYEWLTYGADGLVPALTEFYRNGPGAGGQNPRQYKNNFVVLVADRDDAGEMERHARRCLAARYIKDNPPDSLQSHQLDNLNAELSGAEKDLNIAVQRRYVHLYYPSTNDVVNSDTLLRREFISPEIASERPGDGQYAIQKTLVDRRKLVSMDNADLDPESYWKQRPNLLNGKVALASLKEEFARAPGNYMLLNDSVALKLLQNALDREAITIRTGAGQIITKGNELIRLDSPDSEVYLRQNACPDCGRFQDDCECKTQEPQLCEKCSKEAHPGPCDAPPPPPIPLVIPPFDSGLATKPLNVLAGELRRHLEDNKATFADVASVKLGGGDAAFISFLGSVLGQGAKATVTYQVSRGSDVNLSVSNLDLAEWSGVISQIAPHLEKISGAMTMEASVEVSGDGNTPEQLETFIGQLPSSHEAGMEATFKPRQQG